MVGDSSDLYLFFYSTAIDRDELGRKLSWTIVYQFSLRTLALLEHHCTLLLCGMTVAPKCWRTREILMPTGQSKTCGTADRNLGSIRLRTAIVAWVIEHEKTKVSRHHSCQCVSSVPIGSSTFLFSNPDRRLVLDSLPFPEIMLWNSD